MYGLKTKGVMPWRARGGISMLLNNQSVSITCYVRAVPKDKAGWFVAAEDEENLR